MGSFSEPALGYSADEVAYRSIESTDAIMPGSGVSLVELDPSKFKPLSGQEPQTGALLTPLKRGSDLGILPRNTGSFTNAGAITDIATLGDRIIVTLLDGTLVEVRPNPEATDEKTRASVTRLMEELRAAAEKTLA